MEDVWPTWSPDGKWIAVARRSKAGYDVWLVDPEKKRPSVQITAMGNASKPTWSPDGKSIWFTRTEKSEDIWLATDLTIPPPPAETKKPAFKTVPAKDGTPKPAPKSGKR